MKTPFFTFSLVLIFLALSALDVAGQQDADDVVRITSNLIQIDALVTDKDGNQVTNLTADEFEIWQDGKPQKITNLSYINTEAGGKTTVAAAQSDKKSLPAPPVKINAGNAGRLLTFIVDDGNCAASLVGINAMREALEKFVNQQMQPNDLVAIYRTRGGSSLLQQYTADKTQLMRVVRKIRWLPALGFCGTRGGDVFEAARADYTVKANGEGRQTFETAEDRKRREAGEDFNRDNQIVGTVGVLRYIVNGLERVGGRKTVFLMSDGLPIRARDGKSLQAFDVLRDLTDSANRASVVFNVIDSRGLLNPSAIQASDEILPDTPDAANPTGTDKITSERTAEIRNTQDGMFFLANETGGRFYQGNNFLDVPIRRALSLEKGYYLLAYQPEDDSFKGKQFHKIEVKVKRADLRVRSRSGFLSVTDEALKPKKRTGDSELYEALVTPLPNAGLNLRLSAFFGNTTAENNFVRALLHINGDGIIFADGTNGNKKVVFDVIAVTLNEKNAVVDEFNRTHTVQIPAESVASVKQNGLLYSADVLIKKSGAYNFRVAVRDASSKLLGSATQTIEVPDLKKGKLYLSGLSVSGVDANGKFTAPGATKPENAFSPTLSSSVPAVRRFAPNSILAYSYNIYNAQTDKTTNQPKLTAQVKLYRDGQLLSDDKPQPLQLEQQSDLTRINDYGYLKLNPNAQPGDYALEIILTDTLSNRTVSQWIDFEVAN